MGTTAQKLQKLVDNKSAIKTALANKRFKDVGNNMSTWPSEIEAIEPPLETLYISENGEHDVKDYKNVSVGIVAQGDETLIGFIKGDLTELNIPYGTTEIREGLCKNMTSLKKVDIPLGVTYIYKEAFSGCTYLEEVSLPDGLVRINSNAFSGCSNLKDLVIPDSVVKMESGIFQNCNSLTYIEIPEGIKEIEGYFFSYCRGLKTVVLPNSITTLGSEVFNNCSALVDVNIPTGIKSLPQNGFQNCTSLTHIEIPDNIKSIDYGAFKGCSSLTYLEIPESVTGIYSYSLQIGSSTNKATIVIKSSTPPSIYANAININTTERVFVNKGTRTAFINATNWSTYESIIVEKNNVLIHIPSSILNNENYTYSIDNGETYNQFTSDIMTLESVAQIKMKSTTADTTILIGTTEGGNDVGTISNSELTFSFSGDTTIYLTIQ